MMNVILKEEDLNWDELEILHPQVESKWKESKMLTL